MSIPLVRSALLHERQTRTELAAFIAGHGRLSMGQECEAFELAFAAFLSTSDAVLLNSGGSANLAALQALLNLGRLKRGDRVAFSSLTWATNVMPILQLGLIPVPVDCDPDWLNVTSATLRPAWEEEHFSAFFATHVLGFAGDMPAIAEFCRDAGVLLLEDNCEALGSEVQGRRTGTFGLLSTHSFYVSHHLSTIEGGMVSTCDQELADMLRLVRANGWDRNLPPERQALWRRRHGIASNVEASYTFYDLGYNFRPTEVTGFLGNCQLPHLATGIRQRELNFLRLECAVRENSELMTPEHGHMTRLSNFAFPVIARSPEMREAYLERFLSADIEVRPLIAGDLSRQPFYRKYCPETPRMPGTAQLHATAFYCGNYPELVEHDLQVIESCLQAI